MAEPNPGASPRVSVVIPAYRAAATIRRAIESVLQQTQRAAEIIVVDDGSPDELASIVERSYGSQVTLLRKANGGAASARNAGIDRSTGDYVAFLDADDYWETDKLALQLAIFDRYHGLGLVAGAFYEEPPNEPRVETPVRPGPRDSYERLLQPRGADAFRLGTMIWTSTVLVTRTALGNERFFDGLELAEDRDLWIRIVSRHSAYLILRPLATAVLIKGSLSRMTVDKDKESMLRVVERHRQLLGPIGSRVWRSYTLYRWAAIDPDPRSALPRLLRSLVLWPLPFTVGLGGQRLARLRRAVNLLHLAMLGQLGRIPHSRRRS